MEEPLVCAGRNCGVTFDIEQSPTITIIPPSGKRHSYCKECYQRIRARYHRVILRNRYVQKVQKEAQSRPAVCDEVLSGR